MSLRTTYTGAFDSKLSEAIAEGRKNIIPDPVGAPTTPAAALSNAMTTAANSGQKTFTYTITAAYQPTDLRDEGPLWEAYRTGIREGLAVQDIMDTEYAIVLDTSDALTLYVNINFSF